MTEKNIIKRSYRDICKYYDYIGKKSAEKIEVIYDIGANVGVYSICFAHLFPNAMIYAFEPVLSTFKILKQHIERFGLGNKIEVFNFGFWNYECKKSLGFPKHRLDDPENIGLYSVHGTEKIVQVDLCLMDTWAEINGIYPDMIKIDAEGSEYQIVLGATKTIPVSKYVICEENKKYNGRLVRQILSKSFNLIKKVKTGDKFWIRKSL